eukprot:IDg13903t1
MASTLDPSIATIYLYRAKSPARSGRDAPATFSPRAAAAARILESGASPSWYALTPSIYHPLRPPPVPHESTCTVVSSPRAIARARSAASAAGDRQMFPRHTISTPVASSVSAPFVVPVPFPITHRALFGRCAPVTRARGRCSSTVKAPVRVTVSGGVETNNSIVQCD